MRLAWALLILVLVWVGASAQTYDEAPVIVSDWTYKLSQSSGAASLWTTPVTRRITREDSLPGATGSALNLYAARNEFEPVQLAIVPASATSATVTLASNSLGIDVTVTLQYVRTFSTCGTKCTGTIANYLSASFASGTTMPLQTGTNNVLWITARVGPTATAGSRSATLSVIVGGSTYNIQVNLYVYNFAIPVKPTFLTGMNLGVSNLVGSGTEQQAKDMLFDLRFCPTSPTWPSGFNYPISWDNGAAQAAAFKCTTFNDESTYEAPAYQAKALGEKYLLGRGWSRPGFPYAPEVIKFQNNANSRPTTFCGIARGDEFSNAAYNAEWSAFLSAANAYFSDPAHDYTGVATYYVQNEPQNDADYQVSAFLCKLSKTAAPNIKIAVSREPLPNIAERTDFHFVAGDMGPCGYDYWVAHTGRWYATYAWQRISMNNESVLLYSLPQDVLPYFTPAADDNGLVQGVHVRVIPWVSWSIRAIGWEYYNMGFFFDQTQDPPVPGVAAVLFRESYEDYEYLYLANGKNAYPKPYVDEPADRTARSIGFCNFAWTQNVELIHTLKRELGYYLENTRTSFPTASPYVVHSFAGGPYYIDFCDPANTAIPTPLVDTNLGGHTWTKVGWNQYDTALGYGWCGRYTTNPVIDQYSVSNNGGDWVQRTYIYDDYQNLLNDFYFSIQNGFYNVTVGVGIEGASRNDQSYVEVNGQPLLTRPSELIRSLTVRSIGVQVTDGFIRVSFGPYPPSLCGTSCSYTMVNFLIITPDGSGATTSAAVVSSTASASVGASTTNAVIASTTSAASSTSVVSTAFAAGGAASTTTAAASTTVTTSTQAASTSTISTTAVVTSTAFAAGGATGTVTAAASTTTAAVAAGSGPSAVAAGVGTAGSSRSNGGLSGGAIAGIVIAILVLVAIGAVAGIFAYRRCKSSSSLSGPASKASKNDQYNITI